MYPWQLILNKLYRKKKQKLISIYSISASDENISTTSVTTGSLFDSTESITWALKSLTFSANFLIICHKTIEKFNIFWIKIIQYLQIQVLLHLPHSQVKTTPETLLVGLPVGQSSLYSPFVPQFHQNHLLLGLSSNNNYP